MRFGGFLFLRLPAPALGHFPRCRGYFRSQGHGPRPPRVTAACSGPAPASTLRGFTCRPAGRWPRAPQAPGARPPPGVSPVAPRSWVPACGCAAPWRGAGLKTPRPRRTRRSDPTTAEGPAAARRRGEAGALGFWADDLCVFCGGSWGPRVSPHPWASAGCLWKAQALSSGSGWPEPCASLVSRWPARRRLLRGGRCGCLVTLRTPPHACEGEPPSSEYEA